MIIADQNVKSENFAVWAASFKFVKKKIIAPNGVRQLHAIRENHASTENVSKPAKQTRNVQTVNRAKMPNANLAPKSANKVIAAVLVFRSFIARSIAVAARGDNPKIAVVVRSVKAVPAVPVVSMIKIVPADKFAQMAYVYRDVAAIPIATEDINASIKNAKPLVPAIAIVKADMSVQTSNANDYNLVTTIVLVPTILLVKKLSAEVIALLNVKIILIVRNFMFAAVANAANRAVLATAMSHVQLVTNVKLPSSVAIANVK
jgi:hypothetical protein